MSIGFIRWVGGEDIFIFEFIIVILGRILREKINFSRTGSVVWEGVGFFV